VYGRSVTLFNWTKKPFEVFDDRGDKNYELSNHLGNVLAVVSDRKLGYSDGVATDVVESYEADLVSANDYYPFGMAMPQRTYNSPDYRYGFNGKEKDESGEWGDLTHYDYGFRIYNPGIGRFLSVDPLSPDYPMLTPYQFASNTPIVAKDLDGLELLLVHEDNDPIILSGGRKLTDQSAIHIVAHGWQGGIVDDSKKAYKYIRTSKEFKAVLKTSDNYAKLNEADEVCVVLHSCRTGRQQTNPDGSLTPSFAQKMSKELKLKIIAPDERDYFQSTGPRGPEVTQNTEPVNRDYLPGTANEDRGKSSGKKGNWLTYSDGILIEVHSGGWSPKNNPNGFKAAWDNFWYKKDLTYVIISKALNLRKGAGVKNETNGDPLSQGSILTPTGNTEKNWLEVTTEDGRTGWISSRHAKPKYDE